MFYLNLGEIFTEEVSRRDRKKQKEIFLEHHIQVIHKQEHSRLSGDCFGVHLLILNFEF